MSKIAIVIGNRTYSSWSLRGWLALKRCAIEFDEIMIQLGTSSTRQQILSHSSAGLVPILKHEGNTIWETMAICEYLAETFPEAGLWPDDKSIRALCRTVSNEMHAGFSALRTHMPMDIKNRYPGAGLGEGVQNDVNRIVQIWQDCRNEYGDTGPFLFGHFTIADAMYAPVVARFKTYEVNLPEICMLYCDAVWNCPEMREWRVAAEAETSIIEQ